MLKTSIQRFCAENRPKLEGRIWRNRIFFVPFLYKTEINSLARVTKIKDMVKNGAYNYITNHNRPVYTSDTFLYEFYSDWVPSPAMPLVNL